MQFCFSLVFIATFSLSQDLGGSAAAGRPIHQKWISFLPDKNLNSVDTGVDTGFDTGVDRATGGLLP